MTPVLRSLSVISALLWIVAAAPGTGAELPRIASWYGNHEAAVSLRFDDGMESHITTVIPLLNRYGFRATFLVNPGLERYQARRDFWESQLPAMGHRLGNHTMNHRGARDLADADYEIGEASRTIWRLYPGESKLLVFASGGGRKLWGGKEWSGADPRYRELVHKYHLIDLYDGTHPYLSARSGMQVEDLCGPLAAAADRHGHQVYAFHHIGDTSLGESIKQLFRGYGMALEVKAFEGFLRCLDERKERYWIAPMIDVLKYEREARAAEVRVARSGPQDATLALTVRTDPALYDHPLTLILPHRQGKAVRSIRQDNKVRPVYRDGSGNTLADVLPKNSTITILYGGV